MKYSWQKRQAPFLLPSMVEACFDSAVKLKTQENWVIVSWWTRRCEVCLNTHLDDEFDLWNFFNLVRHDVVDGYCDSQVMTMLPLLKLKYSSWMRVWDLRYSNYNINQVVVGWIITIEMMMILVEREGREGEVVSQTWLLRTLPGNANGSNRPLATFTYALRQHLKGRNIPLFFQCLRESLLQLFPPALPSFQGSKRWCYAPFLAVKALISFVAPSSSDSA